MIWLLSSADCLWWGLIAKTQQELRELAAWLGQTEYILEAVHEQKGTEWGLQAHLPQGF